MNKIQSDALIESPRAVTPAKAGVQKFLTFLDSRFHGNDEKERLPLFYEDGEYV
jgi:hypothetical protein